MGRPPKYDNPEKMQHAIDLYFKSCRQRQLGYENYLAFYDNLSDTDKEIVDRVDDVYPSVTGLVLLLGFHSRQSLLDYAQKDEFLDTIREAKVRVENALEQRLFHTSPTGSIFNLKNNYGWVDKTESDVTSQGQPIKDATTVLLSKIPTEILEEALEESNDTEK